ncbi:MAG: hypothetical protein F4Z57_01110 [Gemmatimonadetes bacterium]|nr:hypothetical protein [Gemmatimonadota bacterium]MYC69668.1 hypothetical protein [Gemmatimonadota bacterium]MYI60554.1 hypothetical protein [Gemmatimonadota bacterium]
MFVVRVLASIVFVFLPLSATAQITLSPDDLRLSLGMTWEQEIATVLSSLEDTGFDIGSAGADQSSDLTGSISNSILAFVRSSVISLEQAPDAASFPDADYSVHNILTAPNATGGTDEIETYHYFQRSPVGDVLIGAEGPAGQVSFPLIDIGTPWPLEFGKSWTVENFSLDQTIAPGITSSGLYDYQYAVDAWGEIRLPAGTFDCLRVHQTGTGVFTFAGNAQLASLGEVTAEIDAYAWYARGIGAVAMVVETKQTFASGTLPPSTNTQIARLTEISIPVTAIAVESWGALKQKFAE